MMDGHGKDKYTQHLVQICKLSDIDLQEANAIDDPRRQWGHQLCCSISPPRPFGDGKIEQVEGWPRYLFCRFIAKGGEALVLLAFDKERQQDVVCKFARPELGKRPKSDKDKRPKSQERSVFRSAREAMLVAYDKMLAQPGQREKFSTEHTDRFIRGIRIQNSLHRAMCEKALFDNGYIPQVYSYSTTQKLYYIEEYIDGLDIIVWCKDRSDREVLELFWKILLFVEVVVHGFGVVHADIAPGNILVLNNKPVLIDFGVAKPLEDESASLTCRETTIRKPLYAPQDPFWQRSYTVDIYLLGSTLWAMWARKEPDQSGLVRDQVTGEYDHDAIRELFDPSIFGSQRLREIFERATAIELHERYQDVSDFRRDIELVLLREFTPVQTGDCDKVKLALRAILKLKNRFDHFEKAIMEALEIMKG